MAMLRSLTEIAAVLAVGSAGAVLGQAGTFETATIRSSDSGLIDVSFAPHRFAARTVSLSELIEQAYDLEPWAVVGGPDWVRIDRFTVTATTGEAVGRDRMRLMLQALLADRFQLQLARETQPGNVYWLRSRKVRNLKAPARPNEPAVVNTSVREESGFLSDRYDFRNTTMGGLALALSQYVRVPVIDDTKLAGSFDFRLNFAYDDAFGQRLDDDVAPTIFTALDKQLGLTLVAGEAPLPVYLVRRVVRPATDQKALAF